MYVCIIVNGSVPIVLNVRLPQVVIDSVSLCMHAVSVVLSLLKRCLLIAHSAYNEQQYVSEAANIV
jgi:hypothetical protein